MSSVSACQLRNDGDSNRNDRNRRRIPDNTEDICQPSDGTHLDRKVWKPFYLERFMTDCVVVYLANLSHGPLAVVSLPPLLLRLDRSHSVGEPSAISRYTSVACGTCNDGLAERFGTPFRG